MSKFTDRLKRLHTSRVRALAEEDSPDTPRVFHADEVTEEKVEEPAVPSSRPQARPAPEDTPERSAVRQQLEFSQRIGRKPKKLRMERAAAAGPTIAGGPTTAAGPPPPRETERGRRGRRSDNPVGERLTDLRIQAEALIDAGRTESALPLLHEMAALSPTHTFPLIELARYWRSVGDDQLADLYQSRLSAVAPY